MGGWEPATILEVSAVSNGLMPYNTVLSRKRSHKPTPPLLWVSLSQLFLQIDCDSLMCCLNCSCTGCALH